MDVPPEITISPPSLNEPNGITLIFKDKTEAMAWEQAVILWKRGGRKSDASIKIHLNLVTVWDVDVFRNRLGLSKHDSYDGTGSVVGVDVPRDSSIRSSPEMVDYLGSLYRLFKAALRSRFGRAKRNQ